MIDVNNAIVWAKVVSSLVGVTIWVPLRAVTSMSALAYSMKQKTEMLDRVG